MTPKRSSWTRVVRVLLWTRSEGDECRVLVFEGVVFEGVVCAGVGLPRW